MVDASEGSELLTDNLAVIERAVAFAARRYRFDHEDAEEFAATVHLKLVENDYAILRAYEGRSAFGTFISIVIQRLALDYRIHAWGKFHASAEAKRLGALAVDLELLLHRDGRSLEDALPILAGKHEGVTLESLRTLAARLPARTPRHRDVGIEDAEPVAIAPASEVEETAFASDRRRTSERLSSLMSAAIARLPEDERLILQLRFEGGMTVAQIARSLGLDQKLTYRRIERNMREIRRDLERSGIESRDVADLIGRDDVDLRFLIGNRNPRPSRRSGEMEAVSEDLQ